MVTGVMRPATGPHNASDMPRNMSQYWESYRCFAVGDLNPGLPQESYEPVLCELPLSAEGDPSAGAPSYCTAADEVKSCDPTALCSHV